jgi:isocitrate dehydrogenase
MFEAIHGSAPMIAGQGIANPTGLIEGAVLMLNHIGQSDIAQKVKNALLKTIEDGTHTVDIYNPAISKKKVGTKEFAEAVIENLGKSPSTLSAVDYKNGAALVLPKYVKKPAKKKVLLGVDAFVDWKGTNPDELATKLAEIQPSDMSLIMITNRGIKVWPNGFKETFCTDHWRCRFQNADQTEVAKTQLISLQNNALDKNIDIIKTENLYSFDGKASFSLGQGQ